MNQDFGNFEVESPSWAGFSLYLFLYDVIFLFSANHHQRITIWSHNLALVFVNLQKYRLGQQARKQNEELSKENSSESVLSFDKHRVYYAIF